MNLKVSFRKGFLFVLIPIAKFSTSTPIIYSVITKGLPSIPGKNNRL